MYHSVLLEEGLDRVLIHIMYKAILLEAGLNIWKSVSYSVLRNLLDNR